MRAKTYLYPNTVNLEKFEAFATATKAEKAAILSVLSVITAKTARRAKKGVNTPGNYVNIPGSRLHKISRRYRSIIQSLSDARIIEVNERYKTGDGVNKGFCKPYRLAGIHRKAEIVKLTDSAPRKRRKDAVKDTSYCQTVVEEFLADNIRTITIDSAAAALVNQDLENELAAAKTDDEKKAILSSQKAFADSIEKFAAGVANLRRGRKVNRVFSVVTQAPKESRRCFRVEGSPLAEIDVECCQPALLLTLCPENEKAAYSDALKGGFYHIAEGSRKKTKIAFGKWIAGSKRKTKFAQAMQNNFPGLCSVIANFEGTVARYLQNLEAKIVIDGVCARMMAEKTFVVSVHDALLVLPQDVEKTRVMMAEEFKAIIGFEVKTNVTQY